MAHSRRTLYDTLGIQQDASPDTVRKAYKFKALETHPDKQSQNATVSQRQHAEARFREVRAAFDILSDTAKRRVYDNGLNYVRSRAKVDEEQVRLRREREEWARRSDLQHEERMRVLKEELRASQRRYEENMAKSELQYQERLRAVAEQMQRTQEAVRRANQTAPPNQSTLPDSTTGATAKNPIIIADDILRDLRRNHPEWEMRRQEVLRRQGERLMSQFGPRQQT